MRLCGLSRLILTLISVAIIVVPANAVNTPQTNNTTFSSPWENNDSSEKDNNSQMRLVPRRLAPSSSTTDHPWPKIAWLLSFPNSGTFYTLVLNQIATGKTTATNYGNEVANIGVTDYLDRSDFSYSDVGPFRGSRRPLPETYILTKTHCGGFCNECGPKTYMTTLDRFFEACASGVRSKRDDDPPSPNTNVGVSYNPHIVAKAVHLMRNPFDNVVSRFHYSIKLHERRRDSDVVYTFDRDGFSAYCRMLDSRFVKDEERMSWFTTSNDDGINFQDVPCRGLFYQYIQWHNNAFAMCRLFNIPTLVIYYEDYATDFRSTLQSLLEFLEQKRVGGIRKFQWNEGYQQFYSPEDEAAIISFLKHIASEETYKHLKKYSI